ncbi:uncharacterized protein LOC109544846 [Dendroctonus ponderosae]|uniref:uncharacterized protein LOC109544846 n=1 Tax=Dendroctonus ponderosae TaxID=77166 RepID=UPI002036596D|nr:uncharacterized protein LOC109544846 [Dendroctonus ponderosae]XP_019770778.2 uncharacterized protein LOC109544846 [Dendroctonus ponderosae]XP_019770779.2 uncharacterized protein LOC109544846 [Dendroctonus ponderosae]
MYNDTTDAILESSRFWFQKVLVPIMVCVGVSGNTITVMVLTRRRMRSSTNIYLSALGIADIIYLLFVFLLSFKHYHNIHDRRYELYWRFYGLSHWLCDAASSTSVWLTVSFTIERYIAVCHPMKGKFFCTENRAKTVTVIVYIFCILTTASTTFEYQLTLNDTVTCSKCQIDPGRLSSANYTGNNSSSIHFIPNNVSVSRDRKLESGNSLNVFNDPVLTDALKKILVNCTSNHPHIIFVYPQLGNVSQPRSIPDSTNVNLPNVAIVHKTIDESVLEEDNDEFDLDVQNDTAVNESLRSCCVTKLYIDVENTNLGKNQKYTSFMYWYSAMVWGIVPLVLIATFNCFLISAVYISQKKRKSMTRTNTQTSQSENAAISNENRITIMLIAVVVMFLICQSPTASYLIYYNFYPPVSGRDKNIQSILGNVFNALLTVNAACNFLLYSIMSKKFRSTFKQLFFERSKKRQDTMQLSSLKSHNSQKFNPYHHGISRNASEYRTPRDLETASLTGVPRSKTLITRPIGKARSTDLIV